MFKLCFEFALFIHLCSGVVIYQVRFSPDTSTLKEGNDGIIEVLGPSNIWGTVCNIGFGDLEAKTACYMMGFIASKALVVQNSGLTPDNTPSILVSLVVCKEGPGVDLNKEETITLTNCKMRYNQTVDKCGPSSTKAHIYCPGGQRPEPTRAPVVIIPPTCDKVSSTLRLVDKEGNSGNTTGGRVEIYDKGNWTTVCKLQFDINAARAVCGSLCTNNATYYARPSEDYNQAPLGTNMFSIMTCKTGATSFSDCTFPANRKLQSDCLKTPNHDVGVDCAPVTSTPSVLKSPLLKCDNPNMIVTFKYADNPDLTVDMVTITTLMNKTAPKCNMNVTKEANNDIVMVIPMALCGATLSSDAQSLTLTITIVRMVKSEGNIFKNSPLTVTASCRFPRDDEVGAGKLDSRVNTLAPITDNDTIPVFLTLFRDRALTEKLTMPVTGLTVGTRLFATVVAKRMPPSWILILLNCFTTPTSDRESRPKYKLIENNGHSERCRQNKDVEIVALNKSAVSFNFLLYPLSNDNNPTSSTSKFLSVYLHCDTRRCDPSVDGYLTCSNSCEKSSKRGKRSVEFGSSETIDVGPLLFRPVSGSDQGYGVVSFQKLFSITILVSIYSLLF